MQRYDHQTIEKKWQKYWAENDINFCDLNGETKPKFYNLVMFFYPSGAKIHIGHAYNYSGSDVYGRYKRMSGFNVLEPMGYDAFGLPAENYAIKSGVHPAVSTKENVEYGKKQLQELGAMYDWSKEINTSAPEYYKWTQWLFGVLYKAGLAYRAAAPVNWCPSCKTVLANEQVINGHCERCESEVEQKNLKQWFFKITAYADKLLKGHEKINWPQKTITMQKNWIGRSEGATIKFEIRIPKSEKNSKFKIQNSKFFIEVFTTRPDTLFGATYIVLAPEHHLISDLRLQISNWKEVEEYVEAARKKNEIERTDVFREKTGTELKGVKAINPATNEEILIWVADYALMGYGTGAIMAVPAHDERDWEFAKKYDLEIRTVVQPKDLNCIIVHGSNLSEEEAREGLLENLRHWKPWLKDKLENGGIKTSNELYPKDWLPDYNEWRKVFEKNNINENSTLIGHSAGTAFILRWLSENKRKVNKVILVAPSVIKTEKHKRLSKLKDFTYDPSLKKYFNQLVIFYSNNDNEHIIESAKQVHKKLGGELVELKNKGHFVLEDMKTQEFPELLEMVLKPTQVYTGEGTAINSGEFDGLSTVEFKEKIIKWSEEKDYGKRAVNYKLRDWLISRQRYWGAPIPIIYCNKCGEILVEEKDLPVELPELENFKPTTEGESPLARSREFINVKCPKCGNNAKRCTETMDTFVCSSWYFLRYVSPHLSSEPFDKELVKKWLPVNQYCGGAEHAVMHLLYARFITQVLHDQGYIDFNEPFTKLTHQGMILASDGSKMSKSKDNVVIPDDYIQVYGADVFRIYVLFLAPFEDGGAWNDKGIMGARRFLDRVWNLTTEITENTKSQKTHNFKVPQDDSRITRLAHQTIKKVTEDIENFKFNTAISQLMIYVNELVKEQPKNPNSGLSIVNCQLLIVLLSPFTPHLCEELWSQLGHEDSLAYESWPAYDEALAKEDEIELVVQINGKVRDKVIVAAGISEAEAKERALASEKVQKYLEGKEPKKVIFAGGKLVNVVI